MAIPLAASLASHPKGVRMNGRGVPMHDFDPVGLAPYDPAGHSEASASRTTFVFDRSVRWWSDGGPLSAGTLWRPASGPVRSSPLCYLCRPRRRLR